MCIFMLYHGTTTDIITVALETLHHYATLWRSTGDLDRIQAAALTAQQRWKARGIQSRDLLHFLNELGEAGFLDTATKDQLHMDCSALQEVCNVF
jgi:hypothetical protein